MFAKLKQKYSAYHSNRLKGRIAANAALIRKLNVHKIERKAAIDFFCNLTDHSQDCVTHLLKRFDFADDNSIVDTKEKEQALAGIIAQGDAAIPILRDYLKHTERIGWPLKALLALTHEQEVSGCLLKLLDLSDIDFDHTKVEKNYDLLCHLTDYKFYGTADDVAKVAQLIQAKDERVRLAAVELMTERIMPSSTQPDQPTKSPYLKYIEPLVYDETPENTRLRITVLEAYHQHGWTLKDKDRFMRYRIDGYHIHKDGTLTANNSASIAPKEA